jgi:hypothetical protein
MAESDLKTMLETMSPELQQGRFVFVALDGGSAPDLEVQATVLEPEGRSAVIAQAEADRLGLEYDFVAAWITLRVESALSAVGLTAAVSSCLAEAGVSCNVIAGLRHDHLLVPAESAGVAVRELEALSDTARGGPSRRGE